MTARLVAKLLLGLIGALVALAAVAFATSPSLRAFPFLPSAYDAKESCSCLFVEGRSAESCANFVAQDVVPIQARTIDTANKSVTSEALFITSTSKWVDTRQGCAAEP